MCRCQRQTGYTFIELIAVLAILGVISTAAIPSFAPQFDFQVKYAVNKVASALRFARDRSIRTGYPHGVLFDSGTEGTVITLYRVDITSNPFSMLETARMPVSKKPYSFNLNGDQHYGAVNISTTEAPFIYDGVTSAKADIHFTSTGIPVFYDNSTAKKLTSGAVTVEASEHTYVINISPVTGRVLIDEE